MTTLANVPANTSRDANAVPDTSANAPANVPMRAIERRLRLSGILLIIGLLIEVVCLFRARPLSFLAFITFGGAFLALGLATYLLSLLPTKNS